MIRGGSRIWIAPEDRVASYIPDNAPVDIEIEANTLIATAPVEEPIGIQKQMVIEFPPVGANIEIRHRIRNAGLLPTEFAIWVLTVMAPGGVAITGFPPRGTHPEDLAPSNPLTMWPFTDLSDRRWQFLKKYLVLRQDASATTPQKIGLFNSKTWGAYLLNGDLFLKRSEADSTLRYPDFGSSFETFTNADMLELETLGPLRRVNPGEWTQHVERWSVRSGVAIHEWSDLEIDRLLHPVL